MKQSRKYQSVIVGDIPKQLKQFGSIIVQSPTGSGKSHIINSTVKRIIAAGLIPLVISDNIKIHGQLVTECDAVRIDSGVKHLLILDGHCYVAMTQSLRNRTRIIEQLHEHAERLVLLVDECHRNTMTPLIEHLGAKYTVGFSATPHFKWAKHLPKLYKALIHGPQISELINDGFLAHYKHVIRTGADLQSLEMRGSEYSEESQERVFGSKRMYDGIFEDLPNYMGRKCVIYVASIKQCEEMYSKLLEQGYKVCRYHSALKNGSYELSRFTDLHECNVCVSVSSLTLGWDYPPIDLVVLWRATTSLPLYLQICGRGGRPCEGKTQFTVLDYGGNYEQFGPWDMNRDWNEMWQDPKKKKKISTYAGVAGSKLCPQCQALLALTAKSCYNCGYMIPEEEIRLIEGQLLEVANSLNQIRKRRIGELNPAELARYAKHWDKRMFATRVAKAREQTEPGYLKIFAQEMGYKEDWVHRTKETIPAEPLDFINIVIQ